MVICVFGDSLNYIHIARRGRGGATKQRESIKRGMEIADRRTAQSAVDITVWWVPRPDRLVTGGIVSACCPPQLAACGSPCVRYSAAKCYYSVYKRRRLEDVLRSARHKLLCQQLMSTQKVVL